MVVNQSHLGLAKEQLRAFPESNILVQPLNRDTGPGMLFALTHLVKPHPDAIAAVFPRNHYIDSDRAFIAHVLRAANTISHMQDKVAVLGVDPDSPEIGSEPGSVLEHARQRSNPGLKALQAHLAG